MNEEKIHLEKKSDLNKELNHDRKQVSHELIPPDGGWGYAVTIGVVIVFSVTVVPMGAFGLVYGEFLASVGDETTGTTLANGIFNTVWSFTGLLSNHLLNQYSYRTVGLIGAFIYIIGATSLIFVNSLYFVIVSFGIIQGLGFGLIFPSAFSAFNYYFDKRKNLLMNIAQAFMVAAGMTIPYIEKLLMETYGFRGTLAILAALSLNLIPATLALQPVKWHMKKIQIKNTELIELDLVIKEQKEPLLDKHLLEGIRRRYEKSMSQRPRASIISMGDKAISVTAIDTIVDEHVENSFWQNIVKSMDLKLLKDLVYLNIAFGLSLSFTADVFFISLMPLSFTTINFTNGQIATIMTVFFGADLISRVFLSAVSAVLQIRNRYLFLGGSIFSALFRIGFVINDGYIWKLMMCAALGFLRCFIQTPLSLVISEEYPNNFSTAFSLYMVVGGIVFLIYAPLMSFVKEYTKSDVMVINLLTIAYLICGITWTVEIIWKKLKQPIKQNHLEKPINAS